MLDSYSSNFEPAKSFTLKVSDKPAINFLRSNTSRIGSSRILNETFQNLPLLDLDLDTTYSLGVFLNGGSIKGPFESSENVRIPGRAVYCC